jgi:hypothetical protein
MHNFILFDFKSYTKLEIKVTKTREYRRRRRKKEESEEEEGCVVAAALESLFNEAPKFLFYFMARTKFVDYPNAAN